MSTDYRVDGWDLLGLIVQGGNAAGELLVSPSSCEDVCTGIARAVSTTQDSVYTVESSESIDSLFEQMYRMSHLR